MCWWAMGGGIDWMIVVTQWVAALPGAIGRMAAFGTGPLAVASLGIILLGLLRTPLRWSGAAVLGLAVAWALAVPQPDILISGDGHSIGVRGRDGRLHLMRTAKDTFLQKEWLAADADARQAGDASLGEGVSCDEAGCVAPMADGAFVALALRPEALADDCAQAALVVTARPAPAACGALVVDQERLRRQGALALRKTRDGFAVDAIRPKGVNRPWSPATAGDAEGETNLLRPAAARGGCDAVGSRFAGGGVRAGRFTHPGSSGKGFSPGSNAPRRNSSSLSVVVFLTSANSAFGNRFQIARSSAAMVSQPNLNM
jgi:competence protein ComEC